MGKPVATSPLPKNSELQRPDPVQMPATTRTIVKRETKNNRTPLLRRPPRSHARGAILPDTPANCRFFEGAPLQEASPQLGQGFLFFRRGRGRRIHVLGVEGRRTRCPLKGTEWKLVGRRTGASRPRDARLLTLFVGPIEVAGHDLEDLEAFRVGAVESEEVEEVVRDDLPTGLVLVEYEKSKAL